MVKTLSLNSIRKVLIHLLFLVCLLGIFFFPHLQSLAVFADEVPPLSILITSTDNVDEYFYGDSFTLACGEAHPGANYTWEKDSSFLTNDEQCVISNATFADAGIYKLQITDGAINYVGEIEISIISIPISITGVTASSRTYNGTKAVTLSGGSLVGVREGDNIDFILGNGELADKNVGEDKIVTTNIQLTNNDEDKYILSQPDGIKCSITQLTISIENVYAKNRIENESQIVELGGGSLKGVLNGDDVNFNLGVGTIDGVNGILTVATSITLTGADSGNYFLQQPNNVEVEIFSAGKQSDETLGTTQKNNYEAILALEIIILCIVIALACLLVVIILLKMKSKSSKHIASGKMNPRPDLVDSEVSSRQETWDVIPPLSNNAPVKAKGGFIIKSKTRFCPTVIETPLHYGNMPQERMKYERRLIFQPLAKEHMFKHIEWGQYTTQNRVEQGGILIGRVFQCGNIVYGVVEDAISAKTHGESAYVRFDHEAWDAMQKQLDIINESKHEKYVVIGWYHTHPNELSVFMSGTDRGTQEEQFSKYWQFAIVLNPQKKNCDAFCGKEAVKCELTFLEKTLVV